MKAPIGSDAVLVMRANSPRYRTLCAKCGGRVRVGRKFVVDPVDSSLIYHEPCYRRS